MPEAGDLIADRYRVDRHLSRGGMGAVYVATHVQTHRQFAIKLMSTELAGDEQAEARFMREARLAGAIEHPSIIEIYDVGHHKGFPYMVMKLLEGESLGERLKSGALPPSQATKLLLPVLDGVGAAHAKGIIHRDLKPDNIYLWAASPGVIEPKILDFGISKLIDVDKQTQKLTQTGMAVGTPLYMSPEQIRGERDVDARTDVYSLGVILYEMVCGKVPYNGRTYPDLVLNIITGEFTPPSKLRPDLPPALDQVLACAMSVERENRYPDAASFAADLRAIDMGSAPSIAPRFSQVSAPASLTPFTTEAAATPIQVPGQKSSARYAVFAGAALLAAGAAAWLLSGGPSQPTAAGAGAPEPPAAPIAPPAAPEPPAAPVAPAPAAEPAPAAAIPTGVAGPAQPPPVAAQEAADEKRDEAAARRRARREAATAIHEPASPVRAPEKTSSPSTPVLRVSPRDDYGDDPARVPALDAPRRSRPMPIGSEELIDPFQ